MTKNEIKHFLCFITKDEKYKDQLKLYTPKNKTSTRSKQREKYQKKKVNAPLNC